MVLIHHQWVCPRVRQTPNSNPISSRTFTIFFLLWNRFFQMSEAMYMKLPATNTNAYCFTVGERLCELRPIHTPTKDIRFTSPLLRMVSLGLNLLLSRIATSPISRGISWAMMPKVTGRNSLGFPRLKAMPIASPSIKLWRRELIRLRQPVDYFETLCY